MGRAAEDVTVKAACDVGRDMTRLERDMAADQVERALLHKSREGFIW